MAANDGSIVFDTELDNSGFEKDSDKLLAAVKDLTKAVDTLGDNMMKSFSRITPMLQSIATSASNVSERITQTASQAADANERIIQTEEDAAAAAQKVVKANEDISATQEKVGTTAQQTAQAIAEQNAEMVNFSAKTVNASTNISSLEHEIDSISSGMRSISALAENGFSNGKSVLAFDDKLTEMQHKLDGAREKLEAFGATKIPTDDYIWVTEAIQRTEAECDKLLDKQAKLKMIGVSENSQQWKSLEYDIQLANEKLATYKNDLQGLIYLGKDFTLGADTDVFKQMQTAVNNTKIALDRNKAVIDSEAIAQARLNVQIAQEGVLNAQNAQQRSAAIANLQAAQAELNRIAESVANNSERQKPPDAATAGWAKFASVLKQAGSAAMRVTATLARMTFRGIVSGLKSAISKLKSFTKTSKQSALSANSLTKALTSMRTILVSRIKSLLISSITNAVKDGIHALAKYSKEFDNAMSNMRNRTKEIGANISITIGNLIKALEPLITQLLDGLSKAITYINAFFGYLSGSKTVTVAKRQTESYADSLDKASKNAKKLKAEVYGFDELNKRTSKDTEKANEQADLFEEVPITSILPEQMQDVFEDVKQAVDNEDWQGIGQALADGLNNIFAKVKDWIDNVLRPNGVEWARRIAEIFNGLTKGINWVQLGQTVASGINTIFAIAKEFLTTYDFEALGKGIGSMIASWFVGENAIDWTLIGETFAAGLNGIIDLMYGIIEQIPDTEIGTAMANFIKGLTGENGVKLYRAADTIATGLNKIVTNIHTFIKETPWPELAEQFGNAFNRIFIGDENGEGGIDWQELGVTLADGINAAVHYLSTLIETVNWGEVGAAIFGAFNALLNGDENGQGGLDWPGIGQFFVNGINAAIDFCAKGIEKIDGVRLGAGIANFLKSTLGGNDDGKGINWRGFGELLHNLISTAIDTCAGLFREADFMECAESIMNGLGDAISGLEVDKLMGKLAGLAVSIVERLGQLITDLILVLFENLPEIILNTNTSVSSLKKGMEDMGIDMSAGVLEGWEKEWQKNRTVIDGDYDELVKFTQDYWGIHSPSTVMAGMGKYLVEGFNNGLSDEWSRVVTFFDKSFENIRNTFSETWNSISNNTTETWGNIKTVASDKFTELKDTLSTTTDNLKTNLSTGWENIKTIASQKWQELKTNTETAYSNLKNNLQNTDFGSVGTNLVNGLKQGIQNAWNGLKTFVGNLASGLTSTLNNTFGIHSPSKVWAETGLYLDEGLLSGLENGEKDVLSMVSDLAKNVSSEVGSEKATLNFDIASNGVLEQITSIADRLSDIALQFRAINTFLTDAGNFNIPIIASGTEIPYKTRIAAETPGTSTGSIADGIDERLYDQTYILRQILELIRRFKGVDGDALLRAIESLRSADRSYGV